MCFSFFRVDIINSDYRVYIYHHVLLFVLVYRDYGHTAHSNEIALQISFDFSHMYLFVDKSLVSYATMHT